MSSLRNVLGYYKHSGGRRIAGCFLFFIPFMRKKWNLWRPRSPKHHHLVTLGLMRGTFLHLLKLSYFLLRYLLSFLLTKKVLQSESAPFPCRGARLACPHMGVRKLFKRSLICQPATANRVIVGWQSKQRSRPTKATAAFLVDKQLADKQQRSQYDLMEVWMEFIGSLWISISLSTLFVFVEAVWSWPSGNQK